jgi:geranylgeranylglycerol-phosphate geranylgeranyltransferase
MPGRAEVGTVLSGAAVFARARRRHSLSALWRLIRPLNFLLFLGGVALGGALSVGSEVLHPALAGPLVLAMASAALIGGGSNAINDVFDVDIDRTNRPGRPLPSGGVTPLSAAVAGTILVLSGVALSALVSPLHLAIAAGAAVLLTVYNAKLKRVPLVGNLVVSVVIAIAILFGGLAVGFDLSMTVWIGAAFAALTTLAREIVKDIEDTRGDLADGARTLPIVTSVETATMMVLAVILAATAAIPVAATVSPLGPPFLALGLPAAGLLMGACWALLQSPGAPRANCIYASQASRRLKAAMVIGVVGLFIATW